MTNKIDLEQEIGKWFNKKRKKVESDLSERPFII